MGLALSKAMGCFAWWWSSSSSSPYEGAVSTSHSSFSCVCPVCSLSCNSPGSLGKWWAQGLMEEKQINIVLIWKKKKSPRWTVWNGMKGHYRRKYRNTTVSNLLLKTQTGWFRNFKATDYTDNIISTEKKRWYVVFKSWRLLPKLQTCTYMHAYL